MNRPVVKRVRTRHQLTDNRGAEINKQPTYIEANALPTSPEDRAAIAADKGLRVDLPSTYPDAPAPTVETTAAIKKHMEAMGAYQYEYKMKLLHRMLLRNMQLSVIADSLELTVEEVVVMRRELMKRFKKEATKVDTAQHVGVSLSFYDEVRGAALRIANDSKATYGARVQALGAALEAQKDTVRFLQLTGLYEANPMKWNSDTNGEAKRGNLLQNLAEAFLTGQEYIPADEAGSMDDDDMTLIGGI